jgi:hypothetical protein
MKLKVVGRLPPLQRAVAAGVPPSRTAAGLYARDTLLLRHHYANACATIGAKIMGCD